jgi:hypothetical protein
MTRSFNITRGARPDSWAPEDLPDRQGRHADPYAASAGSDSDGWLPSGMGDRHDDFTPEDRFGAHQRDYPAHDGEFPQDEGHGGYPPVDEGWTGHANTEMFGGQPLAEDDTEVIGHLPGGVGRLDDADLGGSHPPDMLDDPSADTTLLCGAADRDGHGPLEPDEEPADEVESEPAKHAAPARGLTVAGRGFSYRSVVIAASVLAAVVVASTAVILSGHHSDAASNAVDSQPAVQQSATPPVGVQPAAPAPDSTPSSDPASSDPASNDPGASDPAATDPAASDPAAGDPEMNSANNPAAPFSPQSAVPPTGSAPGYQMPGAPPMSYPGSTPDQGLNAPPPDPSMDGTQPDPSLNGGPDGGVANGMPSNGMPGNGAQYGTPYQQMPRQNTGNRTYGNQVQRTRKSDTLTNRLLGSDPSDRQDNDNNGTGRNPNHQNLGGALGGL